MTFVLPFADLTAELAKYALAKPGTNLPYGQSFEHCRHYPKVQVLGTPFVDVLEVLREQDRFYIRFPIRSGKQHELLDRFDAAEPSKWGERHGCFYVDVTLGGDVGLDVLKKLIDHSYKICREKQPPIYRLVSDLAGSKLTDMEALDRLIDECDLGQYHVEIQGLLRPALLMVTKPDDGLISPIGSSRLGGTPDLPPGKPWPTYTDGRPLTFMGQFDLAEMAKFPTVVSGMPKSGLLSFFSVFGWREDGCDDPNIPDEGENPQIGWNVLLHHEMDEVTLTQAPGDLETLNETGIEFRPLADLPRHQDEPEVRALRWNDNQWQAFDHMAALYRGLINVRNFGALVTRNGPHRMGGYADSEYGMPSQLIGKDPRLLMQLGCDSYANLTWGDGGNLKAFLARSSNPGGEPGYVFCECESS